MCLLAAFVFQTGEQLEIGHCHGAAVSWLAGYFDYNYFSILDVGHAIFPQAHDGCSWAGFCQSSSNFDWLHRLRVHGKLGRLSLDLAIRSM
jgi:hypothetical protein